MNNKKYNNIDEYINLFSNDIKIKLEQIRNTIKSCEPELIETISYQMPTFKLKKNIAHFAVFKNHIGFYPGSLAITEFAKELLPYKTSKGAIQFPIDKEIPLELIKKIIMFNVKNL